MIIQELDLTIKHRHRRSNSNADTLSRLPPATDEQVNESESPKSSSPACLNPCKVTAQCGRNGEVRSRGTDGRAASEGRDSISCLTHVCPVSVPTGGDSDDGL